jgi:hypothetical protein
VTEKDVNAHTDLFKQLICEARNRREGCYRASDPWQADASEQQEQSGKRYFYVGLYVR